MGARAFDVLLALVAAAGDLVTKEALLAGAWPGLIVEEANVHVQVAALRKALGTGAIATVPGLGYRLAIPVESAGDPLRLDNLPAERTAFVGRESTVAEAQVRLARGRLVTLIGIGGTGKTRLALKLAQNALGHWRHGVWWVNLASLTDADQVVQALARSVGCKTQGPRPPIEALQDFISRRQLLAVLDSAEHILEAVIGLVQKLLATAPWLSLLVTSREALGLDGESVVHVPPLTLPPLGAQASVIAESESVRLLVDRAQLLAPDFMFGDNNASALAAICRCVDGIPLAVELAAAQLRVMEPVQLLELLSERLRLHFGHRRAGLREPTLQAVIQWSYDRLGPHEQELLLTLSVCRGGCDLDSVRALCDADSSVDLAEGLGRLADHSLLIVQHQSTTARYCLLETVRQFGLEKLNEKGQAAEVNERHAKHYAAMIETQAGGGDWRNLGASLLERIDTERENFLQAMEWCAQQHNSGSAHMGLRLAAAMMHYWPARGMLSLGLKYTLAALQEAQYLPLDFTRFAGSDGTPPRQQTSSEK